MAWHRILIVDDDMDIRLTLRALLEDIYFQVDEAEDGLWALEKLKSNKYQLMFLDLMMPHMDGFEVLQRIPPETFKDMPVVILTARGQDEDMFKGYQMGAAHYITKPYGNNKILVVVKDLVKDLMKEQAERIEEILAKKK